MGRSDFKIPVFFSDFPSRVPLQGTKKNRLRSARWRTQVSAKPRNGALAGDILPIDVL